MKVLEKLARGLSYMDLTAISPLGILVGLIVIVA
jgi:hypothetical protein